MPDSLLHDNRRRIARLLEKVQARDEVIAGLARQKLNLLQLYREQHNEVLRLRCALRRNGADMSAVPDPYTQNTDYSDYAAANPSYAFPGTQLDTEFTEIASRLSATQSRLAEVQRDDGALRNGVVTVDSLSSQLQAGFATPTAWTTATAYVVGNIVVTGGFIYLCAIAHTSGTFATDLAAVKWTLLSEVNVPLAGEVVQQVYTKLASDTVATGLIPVDSTAPQSGEGSQLMTLGITPRYITSKIRLRFEGRVSIQATADVIAYFSVAAFRDAVATCIGASLHRIGNPYTVTDTITIDPISLVLEEAPASLSALTYKIRCGPNALTGINGGPTVVAGAFGSGANNTTTLVLEEIKV